MIIKFSKYQGTGNDFIIIDDMKGNKEDSLKKHIQKLCDRRFGIGADGFILLQKSDKHDFYMRYYNSDGNISTMCGNGGRCVIALAKEMGIASQVVNFEAIDGPHSGFVENGIISLKMADVTNIQSYGDDFFIDTGSPHYVKFVEDCNGIDVNSEGRAIRYSPPFRNEGVNVNFVELVDGGIKIATYERGVEAETLSCGTGVTAAALITKYRFPSNYGDSIKVLAKGGDLEVKFKFDGEIFTEVWLCGPATKVFEGSFSV